MTPEREAKELQAKQEENNTLTVSPSQRQLNIIAGIMNDKRVLQDRLDEIIKREKDAVNLILEAHGVDPAIAREVQLQEGKLVVLKHPPIEKKPGLPKPKSMKEQMNGKQEVEETE
jgi:hypothetical protein